MQLERIQRNAVAARGGRLDLTARWSTRRNGVARGWLAARLARPLTCPCEDHDGGQDDEDDCRWSPHGWTRGLGLSPTLTLRTGDWPWAALRPGCAQSGCDPLVHAAAAAAAPTPRPTPPSPEGPVAKTARPLPPAIDSARPRVPLPLKIRPARPSAPSSPRSSTLQKTRNATQCSARIPHYELG